MLHDEQEKPALTSEGIKDAHVYNYDGESAKRTRRKARLMGFATRHLEEFADAIGGQDRSLSLKKFMASLVVALLIVLMMALTLVLWGTLIAGPPL